MPLNVITALIAVIVVGPIDGANGVWTRAEITHAEQTALVLERHGVTVQRFYAPDDNWDEIAAASAGAQFFIYRGHGREHGGLTLTDGPVEPQQIARLHLAPGAVVMVYGCYAAGSGTDDVVGENQAYQRVVSYAWPFLRAGAVGYYSDWYGEAFSRFVDDLFAGYSLGEAYQRFNYDPARQVQIGNVWLTNHQHPDRVVYDHALVGLADYRLGERRVFLPSIFGL